MSCYLVKNNIKVIFFTKEEYIPCTDTKLYKKFGNNEIFSVSL